MKEIKKSVVLRVTQLDAAQLENSVFQILQDELKTSLQNDSLSFLLYVKPELNAILRYILWKLSINKAGITIGQSMFNTEYLYLNQSISCRQRYIFGVVTILLPWVKERFSDIIKVFNFLFKANSVIYSPQNIENVYKYIERLLKLLSLINFILFLRYGKRASILERTLQLDHVFSDKPTPRYIDYAYMRKEMLWEATSQTLICLLPFLNVQKLSNTFAKLCRYFRNDVITNHKKLFECAICSEKATNPYCGNCKHIFCYYCIQVNILYDSGYNCPTCGDVISEIAPTVQTC